MIVMFAVVRLLEPPINDDNEVRGASPPSA